MNVSYGGLNPRDSIIVHWKRLSLLLLLLSRLLIVATRCTNISIF
jgi:hypothetical protein